MKIGIDARICSENGFYPLFIKEFIETYISQEKEHEITIYAKGNIFGENIQNNSKIIDCSIDRNSIITDIQEKKLFEKENFHMMIFFDYQVPLGYTGDFIVFVEDLKEVFFPKKEYIHRFIYKKKLSFTLKKAKKVLVFDGNTALELNEQLDIPEEKIEKIRAFFPTYSSQNSQLIVDIKAKHNLRGPYLIYDSGNELHNNFERLLRALGKLKENGILYHLIILCDDTVKDLDIRATSLELGISEQIIFLGNTNPELEKAYYTQSQGIIFSSIYESFPFACTKGISYGSVLYANSIPAHTQVFEDHIQYFDPLSLHQMVEVLQKSYYSTHHHDYGEIFQKYNVQRSIAEFQNLLSRI